MAARTVTVRFRIAHTDSATKPTAAQIRSILGAAAWQNQLDAPRPTNGAYLLGFSADAGRSGAEIDADVAGHLTQVAWRGRTD